MLDIVLLTRIALLLVSFELSNIKKWIAIQYQSHNILVFTLKAKAV